MGTWEAYKEGYPHPEGSWEAYKEVIHTQRNPGRLKGRVYPTQRGSWEAKKGKGLPHPDGSWEAKEYLSGV